MTTTDTQVQELVINTLTKQEYEAIQNPSDTELYMVTDDLLANFIGADGTNAGVAGLVPPPQATDNTKFLKGNGSWSNIALSSSDITNALGYTPQNSLTAVTHIASTAVGSSSQPVYVNSSGVVTACTNPLPTNINTLGTIGTITLTDNSINKITPSGTVTFILPTITDNTIFHQILVQVDLSTVYSLTLGTTYYFDKTAPDMSTTGQYNLFYEYDSTQSYWVVGCVAKGSAS